jgi:replicative DNA helicase
MINFDFKLERSILGTMLMDNSKIGIVLNIINSNAFYNKQNELIFIAISDLYLANSKVDLFILQQHIKISGINVKISYINELINNIVSIENVEQHCIILLEKYAKRRFAEICTQGLDIVEKDNMNIVDLVQVTQERIKEINIVNSIPKENNVILSEYVQAIRDGLVKDIPTGFQSLDNIIDGFGLGQYIVIAAKPKIGKTTLVTNILHNQSFNLEVPVRFYSLEMKKENVLMNLLAYHIKADTKWIKENTLNIKKDMQMNEFYNLLETKPLTIIDDIYELNILMNDIINCKEKIIYIDYLEYVEHNKVKTLYERMNYVSKRLSSLAKETNKCIVMVQQLRDYQDKPNVNDLYMKVGEKEAWKIILLHGVIGTDLREIIVALNRSGNIGSFAIGFNYYYSTFSELKGW